MKIRALFALLCLSLAANVGLGVWVARRTPTVAAPVATTHPGSAAQTAAAPSGPLAIPTALTERMNAAHSGSDLRALMADLRAAGLPEPIVQALMQTLVQQEMTRRRGLLFDLASTPYWKIPDYGPERMKALRAFEKERRALIAELGLPLTASEQAFRQRRFGNLPEEKVTALEKIQQDYSELLQELSERRRTGQAQNARDLAAQQKLLMDEQQRDIDALLTPEERFEYDVRNSGTANSLRNQLRSVEVNEQEFRALYAAQKASETAGADVFGNARTPEQEEARLAGWSSFQTEARRVLGDDRYRQMLLHTQFNGPSGGAFFAERPAISIDQIQSVARLVRAQRVEMQKEEAAAGANADERRAAAARANEKYRAQVTQILGTQYGPEFLSSTAPSGLRLPSGGG